MAIAVLISTLTIANIGYSISLGGQYAAQLSSIWGVLFFVGILTASFTAWHYIFSAFVKPMISHVRRKSRYSDIMNKAIVVTHYTIMSILLIITLQMFLNFNYDVGLFMAVVAISYSSAAIIMFLLSIKFFSWYRSHHNLIVVLFAFTLMLVSVGITVIMLVNGKQILAERTLYTKIEAISRDHAASSQSQPLDTSKESRLWQMTSVPLRIAYVLYWIANVLLLRNYSDKMGNRKFWIIVTLPMALTLGSQFPIILASATTGTALLGVYALTLARIAIALGGALSAIFFGVIFFTMAKAMNQTGQTHVQQYLKCCAYGSMMFVIIFTIPLSSLLYPPFVLISWSFAGIASYLIGFGYYSLSISVSQDIKSSKVYQKLCNF